LEIALKVFYLFWYGGKHGGEENSHRISVCKREGHKPLGILGADERIILKTMLRI
jgi:hypothetical protein